jgi:hypothetical protein
MVFIMKNIALHIRNIHIIGSQCFSDKYVRTEAPPLEKFNLIMAEIRHIEEEAKAHPSHLFLVTCPEGMIASVEPKAICVTLSEYKAMCQQFCQVTERNPNMLLMPGTIVYPAENNSFHNPAPIFYQGIQHTYIQARSPDIYNFDRTDFPMHAFLQRQVLKKLLSNENNTKLFYLTFQGQEFILAPMICVEHSSNLHQNIPELKANHAIEVVLSYGTETIEANIQAPCFIHDEISDRRQGIVKQEASIFKIYSREKRNILYGFFNSTLASLTWSYRSNPAITMIDKSLVGSSAPSQGLGLDKF